MDQKASPRAYKSFADTNPHSLYTALAKSRIKVLDDKAWKGAMKAGSADSYAAYADEFPDGANVPEAKRRVSAMDADAWRDASAVRSVASYQAYLSRFQRGEHERDARLALSQLKSSVEPNRGETDPPSQEDLVARVHPQWRQLVKTEAFVNWYRVQPAQTQALAKSLKASDAIAMIGLFKAETGGK